MDSNSLITCPLHPKENIKRIDLEFGCEKDLYCIECLLQCENPVAISTHLKGVDEFINLAANYYSGIRQRSLENVETPDEYNEILNKQSESLEVLSKHIEEEKKRVDAKLDELTQYIVKHINKKRDEYFHVLDKQLFNYRYGYIFLEKMLRKAYPKVDDTSLYPSQEELIEKYDKLQNATQLMAFVKNIKEDLNESKLFVTDDGLQLTPDEGRRYIIKTTIKRLENYKFKAPTLISPEADMEKIKAGFEKSVGKVLDEIFELNNEIEDPSSEAFPKSNLLKGADWGQIKKWMEKEFQGRKPKLVFRGTKDGMNASSFHKCCDNKGPTLTVIKSKFDKIFGGFIDQAYCSKNNYINSKNGWLFSINAKAKYVLSDPNSHSQYGAYDYSTYGPTFGGGHDIYLATDFTTNSNYCNRYSYNFPDNTTLTGGYNFQVEEVEVYSYDKK